MRLDVFIEPTEGMKIVFVELNFSNHELRIKDRTEKILQ